MFSEFSLISMGYYNLDIIEPSKNYFIDIRFSYSDQMTITEEIMYLHKCEKYSIIL